MEDVLLVFRWVLLAVAVIALAYVIVSFIVTMRSGRSWVEAVQSQFEHWGARVASAVGFLAFGASVIITLAVAS